jgi:hypothetical protein
MEQQLKPKHTSTILFFIILALGIAAFVVIYFFGDDIKSALSQEDRPEITTEAPAFERPEEYTWEETWPETQPTQPEQTVPVITRPPATQPPATPPAAPAGIDVAAAFPGAKIKEKWVDNQWLLTVPALWKITVPEGWIANTDPHRWTIVPMPANYTGASGEIIPAGTFIQAMVAGTVYVRYVG